MLRGLKNINTPGKPPERKDRVVTDIRGLNKISMFDAYPMTLQTDVIAAVLECPYISVMDCASFFHQWLVQLADRHKLTIILKTVACRFAESLNFKSVTLFEWQILKVDSQYRIYRARFRHHGFRSARYGLDLKPVTSNGEFSESPDMEVFRTDQEGRFEDLVEQDQALILLPEGAEFRGAVEDKHWTLIALRMMTIEKRIVEAENISLKGKAKRTIAEAEIQRANHWLIKLQDYDAKQEVSEKQITV
ncbi:MAG: hypothetical protein HETSPECPRED_004383 [Heterodermia speciosa]|uniref:Uncharacterized protein n=1 Tax=Heterodermia speciosa TaxID=116794 RepID=A0A8H3PIW5_9LECA|nr:MAG: hypothetical protein HETSPECPRED_004383 [Heterodermia speciosa]